MSVLKNIFNKKYALIIIIMIAVVAVIIVINNIMEYLFFTNNIGAILFDLIFNIVVSVLAILTFFYLIYKKDQQQEMQIDQLCDAYRYIGQMNRKIDALLELDISSLDQSKHADVRENSLIIFKQLLNILDAECGSLYLRQPLNYIAFENKTKNNKYRHHIEDLAKREISDFKFSNNAENEKFFLELGVEPEILKRCQIVTKPVYMHKQNVGAMVLLFKKNYQLESRDLNIIRVFSFYIALNITFRPDFSRYLT